MTTSHSGSPAPGPLEANAVQFDALFYSLAQRQSFRAYLAGLLLPSRCNGPTGMPTRSQRNAWLTPAHWLVRCWSAFADTPARTELFALLDGLMAGNGIILYLQR